MAINFPSSPANGDEYIDPSSGTEWVYNSADNSWTMTGAGSSSPFNFRGGYDFTTANTISDLESGDLFIQEDNDGTVGSGYGDDFTGTQITIGTLVLWDGAEFIKLSSSVPGYPDTSDPNYQNGTLDERYLSLASDAGAQTVQSTGTTTFDGLVEAGSGVSVTGGSEDEVVSGLRSSGGQGFIELVAGTKRGLICLTDSSHSGLTTGINGNASPVRALNVDGPDEGCEFGAVIASPLAGDSPSAFRTSFSVVDDADFVTSYDANGPSVAAGKTVDNYTAFNALSNGTIGTDYNIGFRSELSKSTDTRFIFSAYFNNDAPSYTKGEWQIGGIPGNEGTLANIQLKPDGTIISRPQFSEDTSSFNAVDISPVVGNTFKSDAYTGLFIDNTSQGNLNIGGTIYGIQSKVSNKSADYNAYNFYAAGTAPNFLAGSTYIGGTTARSTVELWKSTLTEEQLEELTAGTLVAPANVSLPGDGEFARQWWYDRQSAEDQALIDSGELEYPTHLAAATFTDTFALGDNTNINLLSNGRGEFSGGVKVTGGTVNNGGQGFIGAANASNGRGLRTLIGNMSRTGGDIYGVSFYVDNSTITIDSDKTLNLWDSSPAITLDCSITAYKTLASNISGNVPVWTGYNADLSTDKDNIDEAYGFYSNVKANNSKTRYSFYAEGDAPNYFAGITEHEGGVRISGGTSADVENGFLFASGYLREVIGGKSTVFNNGENFFMSLDGSGGASHQHFFSPDLYNLAIKSDSGGGALQIKGEYTNSAATYHSSLWAQGIDYKGLANNANVYGLFLESPTKSTSATGVESFGIYVENSYTDEFPKNYGVCSNLNAGSGTNFNFYANGSAPNYFKGNIDCDGSVNGAFSLRMQSDDPAAFTTTLTTDDDGNQVSESVYSGTTEDLLSIIKDLRARVTALEAAATA